MPPSVKVAGFLTPAEHGALLDWVLASRDRFKPAKVMKGSANRTDATTRIALKLRDLGPMEATLREKLLAVLPRLVGEIGGRLPDEPSLELELTAYGDGAFFAAHRDIQIGPNRNALGVRPGEDRLLSAVYYFHRVPKAFSGGALRLYRWGADSDLAGPKDWCDISPDQNSLIAFATWAFHEVRTVHCPSGAFEDSRFALNCWYCGELPA